MFKQLKKISYDYFISSPNYFICLILMFLMYFVISLINFKIETGITNSFNYISSNCAYYEKNSYDKFDDFDHKLKEKIQYLDYKKINYEISNTLSVCTSLDDFYTKSYSVSYLEFDSNLLKYNKLDIEFNNFSNLTDGFYVEEDIYNNEFHDFNFIIKDENYNFEKMKVNIIGTFKCKNKNYHLSDLIAPLEMFEKVEKYYSNQYLRVCAEVVFNDKIDSKINADLKKIDKEFITQYYFVNRFLTQYKEIRNYYTSMSYAFYFIMIISSVIVLINYNSKNLKNNNIRIVYYENNIRFLSFEIIKVLLSFSIVLVLMLGLKALLSLIFKFNLIFNIYFLVALILVLVVNIIVMIINSLYLIKNKNIREI